MFRPLSFCIGLRYTRARRRKGFISFISLASMLGIALGVMVLIVVLSVMNGFDYQIRQRFFAIAPEVTVFTDRAILNHWEAMSRYIQQLPDVSGVAPYISGQGMLLNRSEMQGVQPMGIDPMIEPRVSRIADKMQEGSIRTLQPGRFNIVIGQALAHALAVKPGGSLILLTPQVSSTLVGSFPRYRRFHVSGIFHTGNSFDFESSVVFINIKDAARLFPVGQSARGFHLKLYDLYRAEAVTKRLSALLSSRYEITNWTVQFGAFFEALAMEKTMLFVILLLIVAVAAFNLVSTLVMVVNDKRADIAILRTLGASPGFLVRTIMVQGAVIGCIGTVLGLVFGLLLAAYVTPITNWIQNLWGVHFLRSSVYFLDYLPSLIQLSDVLKVSAIAFMLSVLATLYPAWLAFRMPPAEALRYD